MPGTFSVVSGRWSDTVSAERQLISCTCGEQQGVGVRDRVERTGGKP